ncbi:phage head completion protein [Roseovarius sp. B08]|uniref:phage head completion protein n=1 Tax=Roseovarius sp. B08 TaxID=3449223 RepID=UPI003EDBC249
MNPADLDQIIGFERSEPAARNGFNEPQSGWRRLFTTYAKREDVRDAEKVAAGSQLGALVARFVVRSTPKTRDLTSEDRLITSPVWNEAGELQTGQAWNIKGRKRARLGRHEALELTAVRVHET